MKTSFLTARSIRHAGVALITAAVSAVQGCSGQQRVQVAKPGRHATQLRHVPAQASLRFPQLPWFSADRRRDEKSAPQISDLEAPRKSRVYDVVVDPTRSDLLGPIGERHCVVVRAHAHRDTQRKLIQSG